MSLFEVGVILTHGKVTLSLSDRLSSNFLYQVSVGYFVGEWIEKLCLNLRVSQNHLDHWKQEVNQRTNGPQLHLSRVVLPPVYTSGGMFPGPIAAMYPSGARFDPYAPPGIPGFELDRFVRNLRRPEGGTYSDLESLESGRELRVKG
ncbi:hypothetical protein Ddye_024230 [Dipteronia dyeriana]|uniref:Uncharacterized protein n=1 Tax=Dipteronia dyeriana TaxID=168575 RepID=A0AAD9WU19_9ROSI|nr:hypothetical protein Ddye_024230 [Dipteronia dyeriana]